MNKTKILIMMIILLSIAGISQAEEKKLGVSLDLTYMSKYMSKGSEGYGQQGGLFETVDMDLYGSGFGVSVTHQSATRNGNVNKSRYNYRPYYKSTAFKDARYEMKYDLGVQYEHYYKINSNNANTTWEWKFAFSWPKLIGNGLVPNYTAYYEYPAHNNDIYRDKAGWVHQFGLSYDLNTSQLPNPLRLSADVSYTDGLGGSSKDHDWSHATLGVSTKFKISENLSFVPGLYHQISMDDSVCKRDVTYCKLSMKYKF